MSTSLTALFTRDEWRGRPYLLSPALDFLMAGGGALIAVIAMMLFMPWLKQDESAIYSTAYLAVAFSGLAYLVNYPHFMMSYQMFYRRIMPRLEAVKPHPGIWWRTVNAGFFMPVLLVVLLALALREAMNGNYWWMGLSLQIMYFFVGWHYVKQSFGVLVVLSSLKGIFYSPAQRRVLIANAYLVWMCSWVYISYTSKFFGPDFRLGSTPVNQQLGYEMIEMPGWVQVTFLVLASISTLAALAVFVMQARATGKRPSVTGLMGYLSMYYLWAFVTVLHPDWALVAPMFHSLQYMLFVIAYKRGEFRSNVAKSGFDAPEADPKEYRRLRNRTQEFFGFAFLLGVVVYSVIPTVGYPFAKPHWQGEIPPHALFMIVIVFTNVHHYFIDNVLWRKENPGVGEYLIGWRKARKPA